MSTLLVLKVVELELEVYLRRRRRVQRDQLVAEVSEGGVPVE